MTLVPAVLGSARLGNFRLGYLPAVLRAAREVYVTILIDGAVLCVRVGSVTIRDVINDEPNTMDLVIGPETPPVNGAAVRVTINSDDPRLLFTGTLQVLDLTYQGRQHQSVYPCRATDDTFRANRRIPLANYTNVSATTIATALVTTFVPGFTADHVQAGLPEVSILFDGSEGGVNGCLRALCKLIGGYFYWEDRDLHLFQTESASDAPDPITEAYRFLEQPRIRSSSDDSQLRTRNYGKGAGVELLADVDETETILPVPDASIFTPTGGQLIIALYNLLTYTGVILGGDGALIGPAVQPTTAPTLEGQFNASGNIEAGAHDYAYTFVTAGGESLPSPIASVTLDSLADPTTAPTAQTAPDAWYGLNVPGGSYKAKYVYARDTFAAVATLPSGASGTATANSHGSCAFSIPYSSNPSVLYIVIYLTTNGGSTYYREGAIANNSAGSSVLFQTGSWTDAELATQDAPPSSNTFALKQVAYSAIAVGPSGTTARKVYRTAANASQLKLLATISDNSTTSGTDTAADASLGANVPTVDTSGLSTVEGQVQPGDTAIEVSSIGAFEATGGWVHLPGNQVVRYSAAADDIGSPPSAFLTGIPASGRGSITAAVKFGATITAAPVLTGVTGLDAAFIKGTPVHLWVQVDDLAAQAVLAARDGTDGIIEHRISDERRGEASLRALCGADLAQFSLPLVTVQYATRDPKTKSGRPISINLTTPPVVDDLVIQDVTIDEINTIVGVGPRFTVRASSARFSVEDLLRRLTGTLEGR